MKDSREFPKLPGVWIALVVLAIAGSANAAIVVNPGNVGDVFSASESFTVTAEELLQDDSFDIVWSDMKHVQLFGGSTYAIGLSAAISPITPFFVFLTDELGNEIPDTASAGLVTPNPLFWGTLSVERDILFHDLHYTLEAILLPTSFDATVSIALVEGTSPLIGEWGEEVPEPSTSALLLIALAGLGLTGKRRRGAHLAN